ncbi:potassium channel family protein [Ulvibacterium sp.]|uniref:potassium channel family protein n=1 Tax=Ulvibacterium sp. TaxID=2665914 RepID=UPI00260B2D82|nr:potassium channel family protein [Ulvibacterium sp.]
MLLILFGSLLFPVVIFQEEIIHIFFLVNILSGILLVSKTRKFLVGYLILFVLGVSFFGYTLVQKLSIEANYQVVRLAIYTLFYALVTLEIIRQVWHAKKVGKNVIIGLMSAYVSLGLLSFFIFLSIELIHPSSFSGSAILGTIEQKSDALLYFSYITLLTIGYGDIAPLTPIAQKATVLTGLIGQFYIVIITAVVVEKYIMNKKNN